MSLKTLWNARKDAWGGPVLEQGYELNISPNKNHAMALIGGEFEVWDMDIRKGESKEDFKIRCGRREEEFKEWLSGVRKKAKLKGGK
jgi:hypothetical protein